MLNIDGHGVLERLGGIVSAPYAFRVLFCTHVQEEHV